MALGHAVSATRTTAVRSTLSSVVANPEPAVMPRVAWTAGAKQPSTPTARRSRYAASDNRNSASGNTTNYDIVAFNQVGVIVVPPNSVAISGSTGGAGVGSTDPWANFSF